MEIAATVPPTSDAAALRRRLHVLAESGVDRAFFAESGEGDDAAWSGAPTACVYASHLTALPLGAIVGTASRPPVLVAEELAVLDHIAPGTSIVLDGPAVEPLDAVHRLLHDRGTPIRPQPSTAMPPLWVRARSADVAAWARAASLAVLDGTPERGADLDVSGQIRRLDAVGDPAPDAADVRLVLLVVPTTADLPDLSEAVRRLRRAAIDEGPWFDLALDAFETRPPQP